MPAPIHRNCSPYIAFPGPDIPRCQDCQGVSTTFIVLAVLLQNPGFACRAVCRYRAIGMGRELDWAVSRDGPDLGCRFESLFCLGCFWAHVFLICGLSLDCQRALGTWPYHEPPKSEGSCKMRFGLNVCLFAVLSFWAIHSPTCTY